MSKESGDRLALEELVSDGVNANGYRIYFGGNEHVMKLIMVIVGIYL